MANFYIYAPDIHEGDAVGNHCIAIYRLANRLGFCTQIYANQFSGFNEIRKWDNLYNENYTLNDILFISYSIYDPNIKSALSKKLRTIVYCHNITPPEILINSNPHTAELCKKGIEDLILLDKANLVIANSKKTKEDLSKDIKKIIHVIPPIASDMNFYTNIGKALAPKTDGLTLNFTGRIEPNKNLEDLLEIMAVLLSLNNKYKLIIVGKAENFEYLEKLKKIINYHQIQHAVIFKGFVCINDLIYEYMKSDAFVTTSLHEGFCVPVHEMMALGKASFIKKAENGAEEFIYDPENTILGEDNYQNAIKIDKNLPLLLKQSALIMEKSIEILKLTRDNNWGDLIKNI